MAWQTLPNAPAVGTVVGHRATLGDGHIQLRQIPNDDTSPNTTPFSLLLLRSGSSVTAFANRCAHFGVPLAARQEQLLYVAHKHLQCNVHYARYRWDTGVCDQGDCVGEALISVPLDIDAAGCIRIAAAHP
jgi:nitrite reductase/ring-hydroxylating ferredoxin subunit